jgi:hypothetical protein
MSFRKSVFQTMINSVLPDKVHSQGDVLHYCPL